MIESKFNTSNDLVGIIWECGLSIFVSISSFSMQYGKNTTIIIIKTKTI